MRPINLDAVRKRLPADRNQQAKDALDAIAALAPPERAKAINKLNRLWSELKELLREISNEKCWYCESIDDRSDNAVDHFRPKNSVVDAPGHDGYWWLAFDWHNYRFACTFCNSARKSDETAGGKQDRFPLWVEAKRARKPGDPIEDEEPILLDPVSPADTALLTFDDNGKAAPVASKEKNPLRHERAAQSITAYHLDESGIRIRRFELMSTVQKEIREAHKYYVRSEKDNDLSARQTYAERFAALFDRIQPKAEYSMAARAAIASLRSEFPMAEDLLRVS